MPKLAKIGYFLGRFWGPKQSNLSKYVLNLCKWIIAAVDQAFFGCWQIKIQSKYQKKLKNSILGIKSCAKSSWQKIKVWNEGKYCGYMLFLPQDCFSSILCPIIPSNQPKNAKIGQNRLFLRYFGSQNCQVFQNISWICVNEEVQDQAFCGCW